MIRAAETKDLDALVDMGLQFIAQTSYQDSVTKNPACLRAFAASLLTNPDGAIFVAERNGVAIGMIGILAFVHHMTGVKIAVETFWWMDPRARGDGVRLLARAEAWAKEHGAVSMQMVAPTERVGQFYERRGYRRVETTYERVCA
jgi:GNAT superfamily N-acetyltransferase